MEAATIQLSHLLLVLGNNDSFQQQQLRKQVSRWRRIVSQAIRTNNLILILLVALLATVIPRPRIQWTLQRFIVENDLSGIKIYFDNAHIIIKLFVLDVFVNIVHW